MMLCEWLRDLLSTDELLRCPNDADERVNDPHPLSRHKNWTYLMRIKLEKLAQETEFSRNLQRMVTQASRDIAFATTVEYVYARPMRNLGERVCLQIKGETGRLTSTDAVVSTREGGLNVATFVIPQQEGAEVRVRVVFSGQLIITGNVVN
eukprot:m51a1_g993 hypothetical protein (151) ;mRNA; r:504684-505238